MTKIHNANRTIQVRVKEGSSLDRLLRKSKHKTISGALHEIAAQHELLLATRQPKEPAQ